MKRWHIYGKAVGLFSNTILYALMFLFLLGYQVENGWFLVTS